MLRQQHLSLYALVAVVALLLPTGGTAAEPSHPQLAVVISVDQMRADYLERFRPYFGKDGFERLLSGGAVYLDCHYRSALTATAPGHATLLTGVHANIHGIVANEWRDKTTWKARGAIEDDAFPLVGVAPTTVHSPGGVFDDTKGAAPSRLLATNVSDQLKLRYGAGCRVLAVSNKDRAGILLGGHFADAAYWQHEGRFITSRFYRDSLPPWVEAFNAELRVEKAFGTTWTRLLDASIYDTVQGPDNAPGEESRLGLGITFPHRIDGGETTLSSKFYEAYRLTPSSTELLGQFVQHLVVEEKLGKHPMPDLLCIGFSQVDYAGHSFGPDSHEVMDTILRLDRVIAELLAFFDKEIGAGHYTVVLSADHAVSPLPERIKGLGRGVTSGRLDFPTLNGAVEKALVTAFGPPPENHTWTIRDAYGYHLVRESLAARKVALNDAAAIVKSTLLTSPQVATAWTREELLALTDTTNAPHLAAWRLSFHPERSPDVLFTPQPYVVDRTPAGANHGTPYDYDNHVPLVWYGFGVTAGQHSERVGPDSIAPTLAALLGVPPPPEARAPRLF